MTFPHPAPRTSSGARAARWLGRAILGTVLALLASLIFGFLIGLALRGSIERPARYIGGLAPDSPVATLPALEAHGAALPVDAAAHGPARARSEIIAGHRVDLAARVV